MNAESVKARLKNFAVSSGCTFQDAPLESSIAEKLEAIVKNGFLNSRYKDFYDIYVLSEKYPFNYEELSNAVMETFTNRKTPITMETTEEASCL